MSSTAVLLSAVMERLENLRAKCGGEVDANVRELRQCLEELGELLDGKNRNVDVNNKVIQIAYEVENAVERQVTLEKGSKKVTLFNRCTGKVPLQNFLQNIKKRTEDLKHYSSRPLVATATNSEAEISSFVSSRCGICGQQDNLRGSDTFGLKDQMDRLWSKLSNNLRGLTQIVITGMAGIGKTTLARKIFDEKVGSEFNVRAWACVSRESKLNNDVLVSLLLDIDKELSRDELLRYDITKLKTVFAEKILGNRFFIILDGVSSTEFWDSVRGIFPDNNKGSRVLITTRVEELGHYPALEEFKVPPLNRKYSQELFIKRSEVRYPGNISENASLQNTVNIILRMCQGIPTEIIRVAGMFKGKKVEEWDDFFHQKLIDEKLETSVLKSLALSYDSLEPDVKLCFLYLGQFPPDQTIQVEKLYSMWIADGLVPDKDRAERYLADLVGGNLVKQNAEVSETGDKSCHLQEMTRKLCILKGKEEGFFGIPYSEPGTNTSSVNGGRAAAYLKDQLNDDNISAYFHEAKHRRAMLFFGEEGSRLLSLWHMKFAESKSFQSTRVLDFNGIDFQANKLLTSIDKLVYLRYLSFARCNLEEFPLSCCSFPSLETLDLRVRNKVLMPNVPWKMPNLKFLYLPKAFKFSNARDKLKLEGLSNLEILENFHAGKCNVNDLPQFKHLHIITVIADGENMQLEKLISTINANRSRPWKKLSLVLKDFDCYTKQRQDTLKRLLECPSIHNLYLEGYIKRMPGSFNIAQDFTNIVFDGTELRDDPMPTLGKLQKLKSLVLCNDAVTVEEIRCPGSSFPELERLEISNLPSLKSWVLDDAETMRNLTFLTVKKCHKLVTLHEYLWYVPTLRQLKIESMPEQFKENIRARVEVLSEKSVNEICTIFIILES